MPAADVAISPSSNDDWRALDALDQAYGRSYDLAVARNRWVACGLISGRWLVAPCAAELRRLILADVASQ